MLLRFLTASLLAGVIVFTLTSRPPSPRHAADLRGNLVAGEVVLQLREPFARLSDADLATLLDGTSLQRLLELGSARLLLRDGETPEAAVERLSRSPAVAMVEPNHRIRAAMVPTDPLYSAQSPYMTLIEAPSAWDLHLGAESVVVAVLDTGIDLEHPDLKGRIWTNTLDTEGNARDDDDNGCVDDYHGCNFVSATAADASCARNATPAFKDDNGHGTFVSGLIAAQGNNGIGVMGIAPGVTILPIKILDCTAGGSAADAAQALLYAAKAGARVANISFGAEGGESMTLRNAIRDAYNRYGMVIVSTTGNAGNQGVTFPANLPQVLAVASSGTPADAAARSPFSNWGPEVAVAAPGVNVVSTVPLALCEVWKCVQDQPYSIRSGTSFSAPLVSGLAALIISRTPNLSPASVRQIIMSTAAPLPDGDAPNWDGAGRIRMRQALNQQRYSIGVAGITRQ